MVSGAGISRCCGDFNFWQVASAVAQTVQLARFQGKLRMRLMGRQLTLSRGQTLAVKSGGGGDYFFLPLD